MLKRSPNLCQTITVPDKDVYWKTCEIEVESAENKGPGGCLEELQLFMCFLEFGCSDTRDILMTLKGR